MEEIDFSELKLPVGRPEEDNVDQVDLTGYLLISQFTRRLSSFLKYWEPVIERKASPFWKTKTDKQGRKYRTNKYLENYQEFYGELIERFSSYGMHAVEIMEAESPLAKLMVDAEIADPTIFPDPDDNEAFLAALKEAAL